MGVKMTRGLWRVVGKLVLVVVAAIVPWQVVRLPEAQAQTDGACTLLGAQTNRLEGGSRPLVELDPATGALVREIGETGFGLTGLAVSPVTGELFGVTSLGASSQRDLIKIDRSTGAGTVVGPIGLGFGGVADLAFRADGTLYGWSENSDDLITIDTSTGAGTIVGNAGISTRGSGLAFSSAGTLFLTGNNGNGPLRTVNTTTGLTSIVATLSGAPRPTQPINALSFDASGTLFGVNQAVASSGPAFLITINTTTGAISTRGQTIDGLDAIEFVCDSAPVSRNDPNNDDERKKETEEQRQQRQHTNKGHRGDVKTEGNVLEVEKTSDGKHLLVTIGLTRNERIVVQVTCIELRCPDISVGDYLEADGYENGVGDPNTYFIAEDVTITRSGKRVR
jgi:hypothetical protein